MLYNLILAQVKDMKNGKKAKPKLISKQTEGTALLASSNDYPASLIVSLAKKLGWKFKLKQYDLNFRFEVM